MIEANRVGGEPLAVVERDLDAPVGGDPVTDGGEPCRGECLRQIHDFAARQRHERGIHVIEARVR